MGAKLDLRQVTTRPGICEVYHNRHAEIILCDVVTLCYNSAKQRKENNVEIRKLEIVSVHR